MHIEGARFQLGRTMITRTALEAIHPMDVTLCLRRHACADWGECDPEDSAENDFAISAYLRILSVYSDRNGVKFWIITEADRSSTTVLLPSDY